MLSFVRRLIPDPQISKHLLREEGEVIVDVVPHHWVVYVLPEMPDSVLTLKHAYPGAAVKKFYDNVGGHVFTRVVVAKR